MQKMGSVASDADVATSEAAVGHALRTFEDFADEAIAAWKK
ncbi:MAG: hypothetical protein ACPHGY_06700 [Rhodospirillaceae bacterium]